MNPILGWALAALLLVAAWQGYGCKGIALGVTLIVFWLMLQFNRSLRVMRNAGSAPVGHVDSAVMLNAKLRAGMQMLQVLTPDEEPRPACRSRRDDVYDGPTTAARRSS